MDLQAFLDSHVGQSTDLDGMYGAQCVDLADAWANACGRPLPAVGDQGAKFFAGLSIPGWTWVPNTPEGIPPPGALVVWDTRIGPYGHVAVRTAVPATVDAFQSLDQNWVNSSDNGSPAAFVTHNYNGVAGWQVLAESAAAATTAPSLEDRVAALERWRDAEAGPNLSKLNQVLGAEADARKAAGF